MRIVLASLCFIAIAGSASAQRVYEGEAAQTPSVLDQVYACAEIAEESARLACYDGAVGQMRAAQASGDLVAVDRAQAQELQRDAFGFSLPSLPRLFGGGDENDGVDVAETQLEIARVRRQRYGPAVFTMTNGQIWEQIDDENARNVREGGTVTIRRATLSSFLMSVDAGGPAIRVRRRQ